MASEFLRELDPDRAWQQFLEQCLATIERTVRRSSRDPEEARDDLAEVLRRMRRDWPALLRRYEQSRPRADGSFRVWLSVVSRNLAVDVRRARRGRFSLPRSVARLEPWRQRLWRLVWIEGRSLTEARAELGREELWSGDLTALATALQELEATVPSRAPRRPPIEIALGGTSGGVEQRAECAADSGVRPDVVAQRRAAQELWREKLEELEPEARLLLRLYYMEDSTAADVARTLGLANADQVYDRAQKLVRHLRSEAERCGLGCEDLEALAEVDWNEPLDHADRESVR